MRHRARSVKLGRNQAHRSAMYRNMVTSLLDHERIETTDAKAKQVRRLADRMITLGKRGTLHARRQALAVIRDRDVAAKVFDDLAERFRTRPGGYTRVLKLRRRVGDAADLSLVELVDGPASEPAEKSAKGKKKATAKSADAKQKTTKKTTKKATSKKATSKKAGAAQSAAAKSSKKKASKKQSASKKSG
jgi:large subunit ribosomal protein L17